MSSINYNLPIAGELHTNDSIGVLASISLEPTLPVGPTGTLIHRNGAPFVAHSHPSDLACNNGARPPCQSAGHAADTLLKSELNNGRAGDRTFVINAIPQNRFYICPHYTPHITSRLYELWQKQGIHAPITV